MSVVLFLSQNPEMAKSCLCFSSLLKSHKKNSMSVVLFSFQNLATTRTCLCFFAQNPTSRPDVCGTLLYFEISVYMAARLRFKHQQAEAMGAHSSSLDDKACLAMLARIKLDICLLSFSILNVLYGVFQIATNFK